MSIAQLTWLPVTAQLRDYEAQAHWLLTTDRISNPPITLEDARLELARWYSFEGWDALRDLAAAVEARTPGVYEFEVAADAIITGNLERLKEMLQATPDVIRARSSRRTCQDPAVHRATLLHYVAANGVESYRQQTPANAVEIARTLLQAGADPNALADMYAGQCTTLSMLVSSSPPAEAGLQIALTETLLDFGADPDGKGSGNWVNPTLTALIFGFQGAAETLANRGARVDRLAIAAGLGRLAESQALLPAADATERHRALALAAQLGHVDVLRLLLDSGEDPNRYNPEGMHAHATPLHQAALAGNETVVRLLLDRNASLDIADRQWKATPIDWAQHGGHPELAHYLRTQNENRR